jgi:hypothetical protein
LFGSFTMVIHFCRNRNFRQRTTLARRHCTRQNSEFHFVVILSWFTQQSPVNARSNTVMLRMLNSRGLLRILQCSTHHRCAMKRLTAPGLRQHYLAQPFRETATVVVTAMRMNRRGTMLP